MSYRGRFSNRDSNESTFTKPLRKLGWIVTLIRMTDWPDLHCGKPGHAIGNFWAEVKTPEGELSDGQIEQIKWMRSCGMKVVVCNDVNKLLRLLGETS